LPIFTIEGRKQAFQRRITMTSNIVSVQDTGAPSRPRLGQGVPEGRFRIAASHFCKPPLSSISRRKAFDWSLILGDWLQPDATYGCRSSTSTNSLFIVAIWSVDFVLRVDRAQRLTDIGVNLRIRPSCKEVRSAE
jgi:hypothetical protein